MATALKHYDYIEQLHKGVHNWAAHTFKVLLSNVAPTQSNSIKSDLTEITSGNGYPAGGMTLDSVVLSESTGTAKITVADEVLTASGGPIGPFRYATIYNDTPTSPADPLVVTYDYNSSITLADGDSFTLDFDGTNGLAQAT